MSLFSAKTENYVLLSLIEWHEGAAESFLRHDNVCLLLTTFRFACIDVIILQRLYDNRNIRIRRKMSALGPRLL